MIQDGEVELIPMLGALMRAPLQALSSRVAADLVAAGFDELRPAQLVVFQHLNAGGSRVTDLAARAQMTKQSMGALVDDLERWGYVERVPDPNDRRARIVRRTSRGWAPNARRIAISRVRRLTAYEITP